jgi:hypothetical protein
MSDCDECSTEFVSVSHQISILRRCIWACFCEKQKLRYSLYLFAEKSKKDAVSIAHASLFRS